MYKSESVAKLRKYLKRERVKEETIMRYVTDIIGEISDSASYTAPINCGFEFDEKEGVVRRNGRSVELTAAESDFLSCLMSRPGRFCRKADIKRYVWGTEDVSDNNLTTVADRVRKKLYSVYRKKDTLTAGKDGYILDIYPRRRAF